MRRCNLLISQLTMGRHNTLPFSLIRSTVTASVRRPNGGPEPARPPLKSATELSILV